MSVARLESSTVPDRDQESFLYLGDLSKKDSYANPLDIEEYDLRELKAYLSKMILIRKIEQAIAKMVESKEVRCPCHLAVGQEAVAVGVSKHLNSGDRVYGAHRSHAHYLALDASVDQLFAEILGKETGCAKGMGGSMHLYAEDKGFAGSVPIVAGTVSLAVGAALALKKQGDKSVAVAYLGDGACEEGVVHECLNLASVMQLPVVFVVENNLFSSHLDIELRQPADSTARFAAANDISYSVVDGNDVLAVEQAAGVLIEQARNTGKPVFLEAVTYRHLGHVGPNSDIDVGVRRSMEELDAWKKRDPIVRLKESLCAAQKMTDDEFAKIERDIEQDIAAAQQKAREAGYPSPEALLDRVYVAAQQKFPLQEQKEDSKPKYTISYGAAIRQAYQFLLSNHREVFVMGQGVWSPWYVGNSMTDLDKEFGRDRVIDTPVSENACTGVAVGAGLTGYRPIIVHPRMDFMLYCMDPIINQAAKWSHMLGGQSHPAVTIRGIINRGGEQGAQHSQSLHSLFCHIPGLRVVMPYSAKDARDLLIASVLSDDPVLYIDDRWLYEQTSEVVEPGEVADLSAIEPNIIRPGDDITIVAAGYSVLLAEKVADFLQKEGKQAEVIDLRILNPINYDKIIASTEKTGRLCVIDGSWENCGLAGEIIAGVMTNIDPTKLKAKPMRVTLPDAPAPTSKALEAIYYPKPEGIFSDIMQQIF